MKKEHGEVNVCVHSTSHDLPCESFLFMMKENELYVPYCEDTVVEGDFLYIE